MKMIPFAGLSAILLSRPGVLSRVREKYSVDSDTLSSTVVTHKQLRVKHALKLKMMERALKSLGDTVKINVNNMLLS